MENKLVKIKLLGKLGKIFGREFECMANSPADVIRFLCANFSNFRSYVEQYNYRVFSVKSGKIKFNFSETDLQDNLLTPQDTFILCPVTEISGQGSVFRIIAGAALIGVSLFVPFLGASGVLLGASLILGGIAELLSPQTKTPEKDKTESFLFDSAAGQSRLDLPIPLLYGERIIQNPPVLSSAVDSSLAI